MMEHFLPIERLFQRDLLMWQMSEYLGFLCRAIAIFLILAGPVVVG